MIDDRSALIRLSRVPPGPSPVTGSARRLFEHQWRGRVGPRRTIRFPLFVFSEPRIRDNIARLQHAASVVDRPIKFCYVESQLNMAILKTVLDAGIDVEVNSGGESFSALRVGFQPDQIIFNGTSKSDNEIDDAVRAGIYAINVDSIYEIDLVDASVKRLRAQGEDVPLARITLRLVPEIGTRFAPRFADGVADAEIRYLVD